MNDDGRGPRPYSTLRGGRVVWVYPGEAAPAGPARRSRLETDAEVRARVDAEVKRRRKDSPWWIWFGSPTASGKGLDAELEKLGLPRRGFVDEPA